ncbi:hypothetical protein GPECTOR_4g537 [Gonium pectorale]|uniref:Bacterial surface antigen (D15) domain-containing protein n=1 Tax=Gonium pectorale TaxID=33097 RepID=A0A150GXP9_GONPE|nr:hypothetical protein GPECTOR_4g537 [Gonium pectorale]|eukprot:KXZ54472.1 hypothetical protein GPECTOR_4g537 [Gonium pectorale]
MASNASDSDPTGNGQQPGKAPDQASPAAPAGVDYAALYEQLQGAECRVEHINKRLEGFGGGAPRTRAALIDRELEPIQRAHTLAEVHAELEAAAARLKQLGVFSSVNMLAHEEPLDDPSACSVEVELEESNWYRVRAATYVQGGENTFEISGALVNVAGGAERVDAEINYGTESSHTASLGFSQPRIAGLPALLELRGSQLFRNNQKSSSYTEQLRGLVLALKSMDGSQALEYELGWRRLLDPSRTASRAVVSQMGDYLKSSLRYTLTLDRRDPSSGGAAATLGGAGWALRSTSELAGLLPPGAAAGAAAGSSLRFVRQQLDAQAVVPMDDTGAVVFNVGVSAGVLVPWGEGAMSRPTCIADRFFLGGPSSLRGFKFKLMFQLPHPALRLLKVHGHAFVNGGNVVQLSGTDRSPRSVLSELGSTFRWSCGLGLVVPTPIGRFEANYCAVLAAAEGDRVRRGMQLGFAVSNIA